jgi:hypothetical protein
MATAKSTTATKTTVTKPATKPVAKKATAAATGKTAVKKVTSKTATTAKKPATATAKKPAASAKAPTPKAAPTPEQRYRMVQDAAYFIAEKNGFVKGSMDYWIAAEAEIEALLTGKGKK